MITIKKYSNRRLYDTSQSQYVTLDQLAELIRTGEDVEVVDAKTGEDLTQAVLAQIIIESRGAGRLLPSKMLMQLIRMEDDALAEFFGQYMSWALAMYLRMKRRAERLGAFNPMNAPFSAPNAITQWMSAMYNWPGFQQNQRQQSPPQHHGAWPNNYPGPQPGFEPDYDEPPYIDPRDPFASEPPPKAAPPEQPSRRPRQAEPQAEPAPAQEGAQSQKDEVAQMRAELDELKTLLRQVALASAAPPSDASE